MLLGNTKCHAEAFLSSSADSLKIPFAPRLVTFLSDVENQGVMSPLYRDHYIHSILVFVLGRFLVDNSTKLKSIFHLSEENSIGFLRTWYMTSIYHDIFYAFLEVDGDLRNKRLEYIDNLVWLKHCLQSDTDIKEIETIFWEYLLWFQELGNQEPLSHGEIEFLKRKAGRLWSPLSSNLSTTNLTKGIKLLDEIVSGNSCGISEPFLHRETDDHGLYGALFLIKILNLRQDLLDGARLEVTQLAGAVMDDELINMLHQAITAIALHTVRRDSDMERLKMSSEYCYAWLLGLADGLQLWNRQYHKSRGHIRKQIPPADINLIADGGVVKYKCMRSGHRSTRCFIPDWKTIVEEDIGKLLFLDEVTTVVVKD